MRGVEHIPLSLPRHAANPRGVGRAGEVWRLFQEAAVVASTRVGWPPERFRSSGLAFVVHGMLVRHHREATYGEPLDARTWVHDFRRGVLSRREVRLTGPGGLVAEGSQRWVHVGPGLKPTRASPELLDAFLPVETGEPSPALPRWTALPPSHEHRFAFEVWHTWMDPLAHVNHPAYVDWCDEATSRVMAEHGLDPTILVPVAEEVEWKRASVAGARVVVATRLVGRTEAGDAVLSHRVTDADDQPYAHATTIRRLLGGDGVRLVEVFGAKGP